MRIRRWLLVVDQQEGRLLGVGRTPTDHVHLISQGTIRNNWEAHEHGRPSSRSGKSGHTYASQGHEDETMRDRFAREVAAWLEEQIELLHIDRITVFAPPRFLGALREAWSLTLAERVDEHHGDLASLSVGGVAQHDSVVSLVPTVE